MPKTPSKTDLRVLRLAALLALLIGLVGLSQPAQAADAPPYLTLSVDRATAHPGDSVTVTVTFTNNQSSDVQFVFQSFQQTYQTMYAVAAGLKYTWTGCTDALGAPCPAIGTVPAYAAPIHPGESRTATLTYLIEPDSGCGGGIEAGFYSYLYYEYAGGAGTEDGITYSGVTQVLCPA
ncbi:hypothetical protein ACIQGZ_15685 [Streptomyces sp. NPDC092296]|uniref:hypothetical protein n=1 Tax=Streptomyces sp. NPDC092296 TaxID=3366012 RepID=UPI0038171D69